MDSFLETSHPPRLPSECSRQRAIQAPGPDTPAVNHQNDCSQRRVNFVLEEQERLACGATVVPIHCAQERWESWGSNASFIAGHLRWARCSMCLTHVTVTALTLPLSNQLFTHSSRLWKMPIMLKQKCVPGLQLGQVLCYLFLQHVLLCILITMAFLESQVCSCVSGPLLETVIFKGTRPRGWATGIMLTAPTPPFGIAPGTQ